MGFRKKALACALSFMRIAAQHIMWNLEGNRDKKYRTQNFDAFANKNRGLILREQSFAVWVGGAVVADPRKAFAEGSQTGAQNKGCNVRINIEETIGWIADRRRRQSVCISSNCKCTQGFNLIVSHECLQTRDLGVIKCHLLLGRGFFLVAAVI